MDKLEIKGEISLSSREREVYRTLRTNLEFTGVENRVIAVTSCTPNDGKSTVAYNLALALAESGRNTLLIDADMRKSVLVHRLRVEGALKGLSHYLSGQNELGDVVYGT
ncbi:MAG: CpsD/CapB family tyrosine-protein kinase, partial [Blautia coccoides]